MFFPFTSLSGFVLSKCLQPSFVVSFFSWHVRVTEQMCRSLRRQPPLRIWVLLTVLFLHLKGQYFAPVRWRRKSTKSVYSYRSSYKNAARIENCVQTLAQTVAAQSTKIINIEQIVGESSNNITKWINNLWGRIQHCQHTRNLSEFIAKQVLCRPDSYSKQEPNVRTLWPGKKTMVSFSPPRLFAAWRVEAPLSAGSLSDGFYALRSH